MSVAGPNAWAHSSAPAETKSGSKKTVQRYQRRDVLKDVRAAASAKSQSASRRKWKAKAVAERAATPLRVSQVAAFLLAPRVPGGGSPTPEAEDEDVESRPSHPSQIEGDEDDAPDTDPAT